MSFFNKKSTKKFITIYIIAFLVLFSLAGGVVIGSKSSQAQAFFPVPLPTWDWSRAVTPDISVEKKTIIDKIGDIIKKIYKQTVSVAWKNALKTFVGKIAYDTATYIATGEKGSKPLFHQDTWMQYLQKAGDEAVGEMMTEMFSGRGHCSQTTHKSCRTDADCPPKAGLPVDGERIRLNICDDEYKSIIKEINTDKTMDQESKEYAVGVQRDVLQECKDKVYVDFREKCEGVWSGFDVCEPGGGGPEGALLKAQILVGIGREVQYKKPRCDWLRIKKAQGQTWDNIQTFFNSLQKWDDYKHTLSGMFKPQQSDFGIWFTTQSSIKDLQSTTEIAARDQRQEGDGFKPKTDLVTGKVRTPAGILEGTLQGAISKAGIAETSFTGELVADTINIFTNTLVSKWLKKIFDTGLVGDDKEMTTYSFGYTLGGERAGSQYLDFLRPDYNTGGKLQLSELICPDMTMSDEEKALLGQNYCVIDGDFGLAIEKELTVGEAIDEGLLSEGRVIGHYVDARGGVRGGNFTQAEDKNIISYRSLLILRKYRIIPVGWELAAQYIRLNPEIAVEYAEKKQGGITLDTLINNYHNPNSPFYHLVDPDWILKAPEFFVKRRGPGEILALNETNKETGDVIIQRADYNADEWDCVYERPDGKCGQYGYCVEEMPTWRFRGDICEAKYKSCQTFVPGYNEGSQVSYLYDTVDKDGCSFSNYGCRAYCTDWRVVPSSGDWAWDCDVDLTSEPWVYGIGEEDLGGVDAEIKYYSHGSADAECGASSDGCHEYIQLTHFLDGTLLSEQEWANIGDVTTGEYRDSYNDKPELYLKLAPEYYNCTGYTKPLASGADNHANCPDTSNADDAFWRSELGLCVESGVDECEDYAAHCEAEDGLCELYTPKSSSGDPSVPAVIDYRVCDAGGPNYSRECLGSEIDVDIWNDECAALCVGYEGYYKPATVFENEEVDVPGSPLRFIASSGKECTQVGCDEFTNLDEVASGGEGIEYFSYLRHCVKPGTPGYTEGTFYTWEGSDTTGYQLKRWELVASGGAPMTLDGSNNNCDSLEPDCREFFTIEGEVITSYWRFFMQTVTISDDCHPFRRTLKEIDGGARCTSNHGEYDGVSSQCTYTAIPGQGIRCEGGNAGCREYKSPASYNYRVILNDNFEDGDTDDWYDGAEPPSISREAAKKDYYSMSVRAEAAIKLPAGSLQQGKNYRLIIIAKSSSGGNMGAQFEGADGIITFSPEPLTAGIWYKYELNLENAVGGIERGQSVDEALRIWGIVYIDEITLMEVDSELLIKNSWTTPGICGDRDDAGSMSPDSLHEDYWTGTATADMLGCESYAGSDGRTWYLRSFSKLCWQELVGCQALIDTKNTSNALSDDKVVYMAVNDGGVCPGEHKGCSRLGLIDVYYETDPAVNDLNYRFEPVYKVINPDSLDMLCKDDAGTNPAEFVNCERYTTLESGSIFNFKRPFDRVCQWKTNEPVSAVYRDTFDIRYEIYRQKTTSTWFLIDTNVVCPESAFCDVASDDNPDDCLVKNCPSTESGCRGYVDPTSPEGCVEGEYPDWDVSRCRSYYYKRVEEGECTEINPAKGCVGFYDSMSGIPTMMANCQPGCQYVNETTYYNVDCQIVNDPNDGKPGCLGQVLLKR